jgi:myo-inositol-1(or 4)-monophosphatase
MADSLIATGFPYHDYDRIMPYLKTLNIFMNSTRGIRRFGSAALDLAYVACGRFDVFYEYSLNAWDVAGGALIVEEAGGQLMDFKGGSDYIFGGELIAVNPNIKIAVFEAINEAFYPG